MVDTDAFIDRLNPDMCVVTAAAGGERAGCLVGFASQCSMRPVRFVVWLSKVNRTYQVAREAEFLAVHLLTTRQRRLAALFGGETGDEVDKFAHTRWTEGHGGAVVLPDACAWLVGRIEQRVDGGDHVGFVLTPVQAGGQEPDTEGTDETDGTGEEDGADQADGAALLRLSDAVTIEPGHPVD
ncbi:flavin reductase family protein [Streptomyces rishiriensis]|uniref:flavin reductase family protein n=1 Tax=Streptomyces rishiriensis TaxID=68264 RepID=UPI0037D45DAB